MSPCQSENAKLRARAGTFVVEVIKATNINEVESATVWDWDAKQDPYVIVNPGWNSKLSEMTGRDEDGGANPNFEKVIRSNCLIFVRKECKFQEFIFSTASCKMCF